MLGGGSERPKPQHRPVPGGLISYKSSDEEVGTPEYDFAPGTVWEFTHSDSKGLAFSIAGEYPESTFVTNVKPGGIADRRGVRVGDVLLAVNNVPIEKFDTEELAFKLNDRPIVLRLRRPALDDDVEVIVFDEQDLGAGLVVDPQGRLVARKVRPKEPAGSFGVKEGDRLRKIGGEMVKNLSPEEIEVAKHQRPLFLEFRRAEVPDSDDSGEESETESRSESKSKSSASTSRSTRRSKKKRKQSRSSDDSSLLAEFDQLAKALKDERRRLKELERGREWERDARRAAELERDDLARMLKAASGKDQEQLQKLRKLEHMQEAEKANRHLILHLVRGVEQATKETSQTDSRPPLPAPSDQRLKLPDAEWLSLPEKELDEKSTLLVNELLRAIRLLADCRIEAENALASLRNDAKLSEESRLAENDALASFQRDLLEELGIPTDRLSQMSCEDILRAVEELVREKDEAEGFIGKHSLQLEEFRETRLALKLARRQLCTHKKADKDRLKETAATRVVPCRARYEVFRVVQLDKCFRSPAFLAVWQNDVYRLCRLLDDGWMPNEILRKKNDAVGASPLWIASCLGHLDVVQCLLFKRADPSSPPSREGSTPLGIAADLGHEDVVQYLCDMKADPDIPREDGLAPVSVAAARGHLDVVRVLCWARADVSKVHSDDLGVARAAVWNGHAEVVRFLCEWDVATARSCGILGRLGVVMDDPSHQQHAASAPQEPIPGSPREGALLFSESTSMSRPSPSKARRNKARWSTSDGTSAVHLATLLGDDDVVRTLVACRCDPCEAAARTKWTEEAELDVGDEAMRQTLAGFTSAHIAARFGHAEILDFLWDICDAPCGTAKEPRNPFADGATSLYLAAAAGHAKIVEWLWLAEANPEATVECGSTALEAAAGHGHVEVVKVLVKAGGGHDAVGVGGWRPIHSATFFGHLEVVYLLWAVQADPCRATQDGTSPIHIAAQQGFGDIANLLLEVAAEIDRPKATGSTPLHLAALQGHVSAVEVLCSAGAAVEGVVRANATPLGLAVAAGHASVVFSLCRAKSNPNPECQGGVDLLTLAMEQGHTAVANVLREWLWLMAEQPHTAEALGLESRRPKVLEVSEAHVEMLDALNRAQSEEERLQQHAALVWSQWTALYRERLEQATLGEPSQDALRRQRAEAKRSQFAQEVVRANESKFNGEGTAPDVGESRDQRRQPWWRRALFGKKQKPQDQGKQLGGEEEDEDEDAPHEEPSRHGTLAQHRPPPPPCPDDEPFEHLRRGALWVPVDQIGGPDWRRRVQAEREWEARARLNYQAWADQELQYQWQVFRDDGGMHSGVSTGAAGGRQASGQYEAPRGGGSGRAPPTVRNFGARAGSPLEQIDMADVASDFKNGERQWL